MTSACVSRLAQLKGHLAQAAARGGGAIQANPLILYDIKSTLKPGECWSYTHSGVKPNVWKTRLVLNYKNIPYRTVFLSFPEIQPTLKSQGFQPSAVSSRTGTEHWTLPAISDPSPDPSDPPTLVVDSHVIAEYLDARYPANPLFPPGTKAFQALFVKWSNQNILPHMIQLIVPQVAGIVEEGESREYFVKTRMKIFGKPLEEVCRGEERERTWAKLKKELDNVDAHLSRNGSGDLWMGGDTPCYVDMIMASTFLWMQKVPSDEGGGRRTMWDIAKTLNGGRWERLLDKLSEYTHEK
ncbi:hypothetical protein FRB99_005866 [Tulasnella sp. 403]|nr:hypothetical protein FRB99_005866 [Tulasnella sp. 403]